MRGHVAPAQGWLRLPPNLDGDVAVKPAAYLPVYEEVLGSLRRQPFALLELGIWRGASLALWRDAFPCATIVGVDLVAPDIQLGPRVHIVAGDQSDQEVFNRARAAHAPEGFDVIIDDASHVGRLSARSIQALYASHLKPGGLYVIEDWGTGYMATWPDGADPSAIIGTAELDKSPVSETGELLDERRLPSHDAGLVGLVKRLVDHVAAGTLTAHHPGWVANPVQIEWMRVQDGLVILKKPKALREA